jgi:hypothetical protein
LLTSNRINNQNNQESFQKQPKGVSHFHPAIPLTPQELISFWCVEQGRAGTAKCKQMEFGKKIQETESGEERKRMAIEFHSASTDTEHAALEMETKEMMQARVSTAASNIYSLGVYPSHLQSHVPTV